MHPVQWIRGEKLHDDQMCKVAMHNSSWWSVRNLCVDLDDPILRKLSASNLLSVFKEFALLFFQRWLQAFRK